MNTLTKNITVGAIVYVVLISCITATFRYLINFDASDARNISDFIGYLKYLLDLFMLGLSWLLLFAGGVLYTYSLHLNVMRITKNITSPNGSWLAAVGHTALCLVVNIIFLIAVVIWAEVWAIQYPTFEMGFWGIGFLSLFGINKGLSITPQPDCQH